MSEELSEFLKEIKENLILPEFAPSPVPMEVAQRVLGMDPDTIRNRMEMGLLDIGAVFPAVQKRGKRGYRSTYISPKKFYELTGYIWKGQAYEKERRGNPCITGNTGLSDRDRKSGACINQ